MPKNMGKGGKSFRAGTGRAEPNKREMTLPDESLGEEFACVKVALGNHKVQLQLADGSKVIGHIRGAMVRKVWITPNDIVIIAKREFNTLDTVDIIHKFQPHEVGKLTKEGLIPRDFRSIDEKVDNGQSYNDYDFVQDMQQQQEQSDGKKVYDRNALVEDDPLALLEAEGGNEDEEEDEVDDLDDL